MTTITARSIDNVGNIGDIQTALIKVDRAAPEGSGFALTSSQGNSSYTSSNIVNITSISAVDIGGSGDGTDFDKPKEMQISNSADFSSSVWEPYEQTATVGLCRAMTGKKLCISFQDESANISKPINADTVLTGFSKDFNIAPSHFNGKRHKVTM